MPGMDELPDEVSREIQEHVLAGRLEWELWLRDRGDQRLMNALRNHMVRRDAGEK
jgi:hypothetical protein